MDNYLHVDKNNLPSTSSSFIADEVASICPLITPSPPPNDFVNAQTELHDGNLDVGYELSTILQHHVDGDELKEKRDSASSSSSALAEATCSQLLTHRTSVYHHRTQDEQAPPEETAGKVQPLQLTFRNPPDNYFFMSWNWPLIRKLSMWTFLAGMAAMIALVIAMIATLPKSCNPHTEWYQGSVFYEIFPASFYDSDNDMIGDFRGISLKADYLKSLGITAVRLNSIFKTQNYPEDYKNVTTLIDISPHLGDLTALKKLVKSLRARNISLILDLPIYPAFKQLSVNKSIEVLNASMDVAKTPVEAVKDALIHWTSIGVNGFYLKGLEHLAEDSEFGRALRYWKQSIGQEQVLIINHTVLDLIPNNITNTVLSNVDLVDVRLKIENGVAEINHQIESIQNGTLFSHPGMPWVHWSIGDENSNRLANILPYGNATLGATLLQLMLPGTPSIFYGNEIGLQQVWDPEDERKDLKHLHQLTPMAWPNRQKEIVSWLHGEKLLYSNFDQIQLISMMISLRAESASIYVNSIYKDGDNKANANIKYALNDLLVLQRWYPRRKSYVVVSNLGSKQISADLSTLLYSGLVLIGPRPDFKSETISFQNISLWPGESVIVLLH